MNLSISGSVLEKLSGNGGSKNVDTGEDTMWERSWFYGMVILGDPNLQVSYDTGNNIFVDVSNLGFEDGSQEFPF